MKIALFGPHLSGHRAHWLQRILEKSAEHNIEVCVYTLKSEINTEFMNAFEVVSDNFVVESSIKELMARWCSDVEKGNALGVSWEADKILHKFFFLGGYYRLLIMRPYLESKTLIGFSRYLIKKILVAALGLKKSIEVAQLAIPYAYRKSVGHRWVRDDFNTEHFFDSIASAEIPQELSVIAMQNEIIAVLGYLDSRKNPVTAYTIVERLRAKGDENLLLLFAGVQSDSFKRELLKIENKQNVIEIDRVLTDDEFKGVIKMAKVILLPYTNFGASGLVLNSLVIGTPVLLQGGRNWQSLQKILGGIFRVEKNNSRRLEIALGDLRLLPQQSQVAALSQEPIASAGNFLLGG